MPLRFATEPANGTELVRNGLDKLSIRPTTPLGEGVDIGSLTVSAPHAVYDLRADAVADGGGLASAVFTGYWYLVQSGDTPVAAAEVHADDTGTATLLATINYGPFVAATARALTQVESLPPVSSGQYEVRLLRFSAAAVMAVWLVPDSGGGDIVYPLPPTPTGVEAERPYSAGEFTEAVLPVARRRAAAIGQTTVP
jgi:hypothetical protein